MSEELEILQKIPTGINFIDSITGGVYEGHLHLTIGEPGVGKSWFCQRIINSLLTYNQDAEILYSNFSGNIRFQTLKKVLKTSEFLDNIQFFNPTSFIDAIILSKKILEGDSPNLSLIVLDTIFGSPLQFIELFKESKKKWNRNIFVYMLDLRKIASIRKIPIIITHHPLSTSSKEKNHKNTFLDPFCITKSVLYKSNSKSSLDFYMFNNYIGSTDFNLFSI